MLIRQFQLSDGNAFGLLLTLAGAQDKLPVVADGGRIGLAINGAPSTLILKSAMRVSNNYCWWNAMIEKSPKMASYTECIRKTSVRHWGILQKRSTSMKVDLH